MQDRDTGAVLFTACDAPPADAGDGSEADASAKSRRHNGAQAETRFLKSIFAEITGQRRPQAARPPHGPPRGEGR
ncbi:MAG: hypothetical protein RH942_14320 [Kiloniellaceae bacterium]